MKKTLRSLLATPLCLCASVVIALLCLVTPARAQVFTGGVGVNGSSNAVVQVNFVPVTNTAYSSLIGRTLMVQNVVTNEIITVEYGFVWSGWGLTNAYIVGTNTYNFAASNGWSSFQNFTTNISAATFSVPIQPIGLIQIYSNAVPWSNNVIFQ